MKYLLIFFDVILTIALTPIVVIIAGVFQTCDEWKDEIERWKRELREK